MVDALRRVAGVSRKFGGVPPEYADRVRAARAALVDLAEAALGATIAHLTFAALHKGEPGVWVVVLAAVACSVGAVYLQRYFIIVGTAFGGAWTLLVGAIFYQLGRSTRAELVAEYTDKYANPYNAAERGYVDDVIDPRDTRPYLCRFVNAMQDKLATTAGPKFKTGVRP